MKRKEKVPPRLIKRTEMQACRQTADRVRREALRAPCQHQRKEWGKGMQREDIKTSGGRGERYSVIETVMGFVRSTCQGQVKTTSVREGERDGGAEKGGQLESGSRRGEALVHANLT
ncbi:hypothetical protein VZT92_012666 [Zoarces viviparus]|uniref:Uncharacterized protein n=1 Tax=Zoarces viviparus TaxID=48416 RepID=A0AAW1F1E9_ZOAVI